MYKINLLIRRNGEYELGSINATTKPTAESDFREVEEFVTPILQKQGAELIQINPKVKKVILEYEAIDLKGKEISGDLKIDIVEGYIELDSKDIIKSLELEGYTKIKIYNKGKKCESSTKGGV